MIHFSQSTRLIRNKEETMAYNFDFFISYAHNDDVPQDGQPGIIRNADCLAFLGQILFFGRRNSSDRRVFTG